MKICHFWFSGTGNTKRVVDACKAAFEAAGAEVVLKNIDDYRDAPLDVDLNDFDLIGFSYPIHAFNAPTNVLKFAKRLPKLQEKKPLFIVKTSGEPLALNNLSSVRLKRILRRRNIVLRNEYHYCMPYNIIFRHADSTAYKMWSSASRIIPIDCAEILAGKKVRLRYVPCGLLLSRIFGIEHWGGRFNGKRYAVRETCLHCMKCVNACPEKNIVWKDGKFEFGKNCLMCMRCSFSCPRDAIKIGLFDKWRVNGAYTFEPADDEEKHKKYCRRAYERYYRRIDEKVAAAEAAQKTVPTNPSANA